MKQSLVVIFIFLAPNMWLFAQEPKSTFGLIVGIDRGYTDRQVNWGSSHNRFSKLYEDTSPNYQVGFGNFAFSLFADLELARSLTGRAQIGGTFMSEISSFFEVGVSINYSFVEFLSTRVYGKLGAFLKNSSTGSPTGIEAGVGVDAPIVPTFEVTFQKPFSPLITENWPSKNGGFIQTPIHFLVLRIGLVLPVWKS